jgi:hypothetical protein
MSPSRVLVFIKEIKEALPAIIFFFAVGFSLVELTWWCWALC